MPYKAVFFDMGNTLVSYYNKEEFAPVLEKCLLNALAYLRREGLVFEPAVILESAWQYNVEREDLRITPLEDRLAALFGLLHPDHPLMPGLVEAFMSPNLALANPAPGALETLIAIKDRGLVTGIISNTPWGSSRKMWSEQLTALGLAPWLDHQVFCMDVGVRKPHPAIFEHAFELAGVTAQESLFVGDDPVWDVRGGRGVGMDVVLFDPEDNAEQPVPGEEPLTVVKSLSELLPLLKNPPGS